MSELRCELIDREQMFELLQAEDGSRYLEVLCGGIGTYSRRIELRAEQVDRYRAEGRSYLEELALRVRRGQLSEQRVPLQPPAPPLGGEEPEGAPVSGALRPRPSVSRPERSPAHEARVREMRREHVRRLEEETEARRRRQERARKLAEEAPGPERWPGGRPFARFWSWWESRAGERRRLGLLFVRTLGFGASLLFVANVAVHVGTFVGVPYRLVLGAHGLFLGGVLTIIVLSAVAVGPDLLGHRLEVDFDAFPTVELHWSAEVWRRWPSWAYWLVGAIMAYAVVAFVVFLTAAPDVEEIGGRYLLHVEGEAPREIGRRAYEAARLVPQRGLTALHMPMLLLMALFDLLVPPPMEGER